MNDVLNEERKELHRLTLARKEPNWIEVKKDFERVAAKHGLDATQGTPCFLLADFMVRSIQLHRDFIKERARWFEGISF